MSPQKALALIGNNETGDPRAEKGDHGEKTGDSRLFGTFETNYPSCTTRGFSHFARLAQFSSSFSRRRPVGRVL